MARTSDIPATLETLPFVDRVEVIDATGRTFVAYYDRHGASVAVQDQGRTIKVFVTGVKR